MKPTFKISKKLLGNRDDFNNSFFNRFALRSAQKPLELNEKVSKDYLFPTLYGDVTCAIGIFLCSYEKAEKMMLHPAIKPVRMPLGRSLVVFSCYIYNKVLGVAPYNEIAMTIPILVDPGINIPVLPMIAPIFKNFGFYVFSMPVTSLENQIRGHKIWGLPKVVQQIDISEKGGDCVTVAKEESGKPYFTLRVPTKGSPVDFDVSSNLYSRLDDELLKSATHFKATFNMTKNMQLLFKKDAMPDRSYLDIGDTPSGQVLKSLEIEPHPFQFRFAKNMSSCFDLPDQKFKSPITFE